MVRRLRALGGGPTSFWRRAALAALVVGVAVAHGCVTRTLADQMGKLIVAAPMPARIDVAYVRELALAAPPVLAPPPPPQPVPARVAPVARPKPAARPASAPEQARPPMAPPAALPEPMIEPLAEPVLEAVEEPLAEPALAAAPSPPASGASPFEWPASTRLSYELTGNYRGAVQGDARVEWVRVGSRYQVHLDLAIGPSFAPLVARRMSSDGQIMASGLAPQRYDQETRVGFSERRRLTLLFGPESVTMSNGERRASVPGLQDSASQFVQLTYLFSTRPELLRVGGTVEVPLALPYRIGRWIYDVLDEQTLATPFGPVATVHLKPRRTMQTAGDLSAEIWFAPQLRYLPLRIRIEQDPATFIDLMIARRPELAAP